MKTAPATKNDYLIKKQKIDEEGVENEWDWKIIGETDSNGDPHGNALVYNPKSRIIAEGEWQKGHMKKGTLFYEDGTRYEGGFYLYGMSMYNGEYKLTTPNGQEVHVVYSSSIPDTLVPFVKVEDQLKGGKVEFHNKDVYNGEYMNGRQNGEGKFTNKYGEIFTGQWFDGKFTGKGTWTNPRLGEYEGDFVDGMRHGQGKITKTNGDYFIGTFENN